MSTGANGVNALLVAARVVVTAIAVINAGRARRIEMEGSRELWLGVVVKTSQVLPCNENVRVNTPEMMDERTELQ